MEDSGILDLYFRRDERAIRETDAKYGRPLVSVRTGSRAVPRTRKSA